MHRPALAALLTLATLPAMAQNACPTSQSLATGITFDLGFGETETYRESGNSVVEVVYDDGQGYQSRTLLGKGLYLLELVDLERGAPLPDTRVTYSHIFKPSDMPTPEPNMVWASQVTSTGAGVVQELHDHRGGPSSTMTIGRCQYDTFRVIVTYDDDDNTVDTLQYLPDLGFALLIGVDYDDGDNGRVNDVFSYLDVSGQVSGSGNSTSGRKERAGE